MPVDKPKAVASRQQTDNHDQRRNGQGVDQNAIE